MRNSDFGECRYVHHRTAHRHPHRWPDRQRQVRARHGAAKRLDGTIINADSMQVYRNLRILSARPSREDEAAVPHLLYGFVHAEKEYTVGQYVKDAAMALGEVIAAGRTPIFVGGTGLYFKALTQGLVETPPIPTELRRELDYDADRGVDLHRRLAVLDPAGAARLSPHDRPRIVRALEVVMATGQPLSYWIAHAGGAAPLPAGRWTGVFLTVDRELLKVRIHRRFEEMIDAGALDEMRTLAALNLSPNRGVMKAHGAPHLLAYLDGRIPFSEAIERGQMDTRRYAKRQMTFARGQLPGFHFVEPDAAFNYLSVHHLPAAFGPAWRSDIDALEFRISGHVGRCVIHRLAFRKALGPAPSPEACLDLVRRNRPAFERAAQQKIDRLHLSQDASLHLTSRDFADGLAKAEHLQA